MNAKNLMGILPVKMIVKLCLQIVNPVMSYRGNKTGLLDRSISKSCAAFTVKTENKYMHESTMTHVEASSCTKVNQMCSNENKYLLKSFNPLAFIGIIFTAT